jgi:hypothetical protein
VLFLERSFLAQKYEIKIMIFVFMEALIFGIEMRKNAGFWQGFMEKMPSYLTHSAIKKTFPCNYIGEGCKRL